MTKPKRKKNRGIIDLSKQSYASIELESYEILVDARQQRQLEQDVHDHKVYMQLEKLKRKNGKS